MLLLDVNKKIVSTAQRPVLLPYRFERSVYFAQIHALMSCFKHEHYVRVAAAVV